MKFASNIVFILIIALISLVAVNSAYAYTPTTVNCVNSCGSGADAYPVVGFPVTGINFDVDTNASGYNGTSCSVGVPVAIGTSVKCAVGAMNVILAWDIGLTFNQATSKDWSNTESQMFQQTSTWMASNCSSTSDTCFGISRTAFTCNCAQQQADYVETNLAIGDLFYTGFLQQNSPTAPRYNIYYGYPAYGQVSMRQVILHELGHSYLLGHVMASDTMWYHYPGGGGWFEQGSGSSSGYFQPLSDMSKGIRALHGSTGGLDVAVGAHWLNLDDEVKEVAPMHLTRCPGDTWVQRYIFTIRAPSTPTQR